MYSTIRSKIIIPLIAMALIAFFSLDVNTSEGGQFGLNGAGFVYLSPGAANSPGAGYGQQGLPDISGKWYSNRGLTYHITQEGDSFRWTVTKSNETARGTVGRIHLTVTWRNSSGSGSTTGNVKSFDSRGRAKRIEWANGVVFLRTPPPKKGKKSPQLVKALGWCCLSGNIFRTTEENCKKSGGKYFRNSKPAEKYCKKQEKKPKQGWCCLDGEIFSATAEECEERGGRFFMTREGAEEYCREEKPVGERGWCCLDGEIFSATAEECEERGGRFFTTRESAEEYCREEKPVGEHGWCCRDGEVFPAASENCCTELGGRFFATREEAEDCGRETGHPPGKDDDEDQPFRATIEEKLNFLHPEYSLFSEMAFPLVSPEIREISVQTDEGVKKFKYIHVSTEELKKIDLDPRVKEYPEGVGIVEGDILFDPADRTGFPAHSRIDRGKIISLPVMLALFSAGTANWQTLWPRREVPYVIAPLANKYDGGQILTAMSYWAKAGFKFRPRKPEDGNRYMYFMKISSLYSGSSDGIGMDPGGGPRTIRLGYHVGTGLIAHEIGHGLGLFHEHTRLDRDNYVDIFWNAISSDRVHNYCKYKVIKATQYCNAGDRGGRDIGQYDFGSIMHYGSYTFAKVSVKKVFLKGIGCSILPFIPSCYKSKTYKMRTMQRKDKSTIVANSNKPSQKDINALKEMYKYADKCGGIFSGKKYGVVKFGGVNTFSHEVNFCTNRSYTAYTKDYMTLVLNIDSLNKDIPAYDFVVQLNTPRAQGGFDIITAYNPQGNKRKLTLYKKLLPGPHTLKITNWLLDKIKYKMSFKFTQTTVPMDTFDKAKKGNSISSPVKLGVLPSSPFLSKTVSNLTIHHPGDIDYYTFQLPPLPSWAIEQYCNKGTGPNGAKIIPGCFTIQVQREDLHRILRIVVYKNDAQGNTIMDPTKGFRPWGWETKKQVIKCPYNHFKNRHVVFSVEDCSDIKGHGKVSKAGKCTKTKRHYYNLCITFGFTSEEQIPKHLPSLDVLPPIFERGPIPRFLTPRAVEFIINQGQDFMQLLPDELKTEYGFDRILDRSNRLATDTLIPGNLNKLYKAHFIEYNQ